MKNLTTDVVIVGAGPVGLFQVFELGLQGLNAIVVDSLPTIGGQCSELYPDKPIYDIPALPNVLAKDMVANLWQQAKVFEPEMLLSERVEIIEKLAPNQFVVVTSAGNKISCRAVVIAAGNGAFAPVKLKVAGIEQFEHSQLFYHVNQLSKFENQHVAVLGGGDAALDWALTLQKAAASVVLIHRSENFRASTHSVDKMYQLVAEHKMQLLIGQVTDFTLTNDESNILDTIKVCGKDGVKRRVTLDKLLVCFGMSPKLGPIANWSLKMRQHQIVVDTEKFQTSEPGIFAIGDINYYPGKRKLILSGFHEAALAAFAIAKQLASNSRIPTLYTTTSPVVHKRMGVTPDLTDLMEA